MYCLDIVNVLYKTKNLKCICQKIGMNSQNILGTKNKEWNNLKLCITNYDYILAKVTLKILNMNQKLKFKTLKITTSPVTLEHPKDSVRILLIMTQRRPEKTTKASWMTNPYSLPTWVPSSSVNKTLQVLIAWKIIQIFYKIKWLITRKTLTR